MSNKREREKRREARLAEESQVGSQDKRKKFLQMGAGAAFLAVVAIGVLIVIAAAGDDGGDASNIKDVDLVSQELSGIPQEDLVLGEANAPVTLIEFGDLQCPVCKAVAEGALPQVIEGPVAQGQAKLDFRNFIVIGAQSETAGAAALAAGEQGRGWTFVDLFYRNQGKEGSGYADDAFLTAVAEAAGVEDIGKWNQDRNSARIKGEVTKQNQQAKTIGFTGTPSFAVEGPGTNGLEPLGSLGSAEELEAAIDAAS